MKWYFYLSCEYPFNADMDLGGPIYTTQYCEEPVSLDNFDYNAQCVITTSDLAK